MSSDIRATDRPAPVGGWRRATVREITRPKPHAVILRLEVPDRVEHVPGQHYVVRLTAPDGYTAQRSYSLASSPADPLCELYIERLDNGEVSTYLADVVMIGEVLDIRGPIGGWFIWRANMPAVGVGGGTGVVPLVAMLRHAKQLGRSDLLRLLVSSRTLGELPYADELASTGTFIALSRETGPAGRPAGRLNASEFAPRLVPGATYFVCGSASFAEAASGSLVDAGVAPGFIRVERFGPSG